MELKFFKVNKFGWLFFALFLTGFSNAQQTSKKDFNDHFFPEFDSLPNHTPALKKPEGFTGFEELNAFLNQWSAAYPEVLKIKTIGESQKGKAIPAIILSHPASNYKNKIKVWMQGGLHGNEPASTEGLLFLIHQLLNNKKYSYLLDRIELFIVPMANIDGYLIQNRYASNGLDLNRDQTKLMAPESLLLKSAFNMFRPHVAIDFHEYNPNRKDYKRLGEAGVSSSYDLMFLYTGNLNVPENLRAFIKEPFVKNAKKMMDQNSLRHHDYFSTKKTKNEIVFNQGAANSRSSATNYALQNTVASLIEVRGVNQGRSSFKRRIFTTFITAISYLKTTYENGDRILIELKKANDSQQEVVVKTKNKVYKDRIEMVDLQKNKLHSLEVTISDATQAIPLLKRERPESYIIEAEQNVLIDKLKAHGIEVLEMENSATLTVESYMPTAIENKEKLFEQVYPQLVSTELNLEQKTFPKGTFVIPMDQVKSNLIIELLEPEAPNSLIFYGVLKVEKGIKLPVYRKPKS